MQHRWILNGVTWHAWPSGGRSTHCSCITADHLRLRPAKAIACVPAPDGKVCKTCARITGYVNPGFACADAASAAWVGVINRYLTAKHVRTAAENVHALGTLLARAGPPESAEARQVFDLVQVMLLRPFKQQRRSAAGSVRVTATLPSLSESIKLLDQPGAVQKVAAALAAWRSVTQKDPWLERFRPDRVIEVMLKVPNPTQYVMNLVGHGLPTIAAIFHPNTLERAKRDTTLRGMFGGTDQYWNNISEQLHIVED